MIYSLSSEAKLGQFVGYFFPVNAEVDHQINALHVHISVVELGSMCLLQEVAFLLWKESWDMGKNPMASKGSPLHGPRIKLIEKASNLFSQTKEHTFESKAAEEHAKLLR